MKHIFITVGTTQFPKLIDTISKLNVIEALKDLGYTNIQVQTGRDFDAVNVDPDIKNVLVNRTDQSRIVNLVDFNITINYDQYFENFKEQIKKADLVISHAGAGSCLEILRLNKPLIVVINEDLMDNHQTELASQLQDNRHLYSCTCETLKETLYKDFSTLKSYPKPNNNVFSNYLDKCCGFAE